MAGKNADLETVGIFNTKEVGCLEASDESSN